MMHRFFFLTLAIAASGLVATTTLADQIRYYARGGGASLWELDPSNDWLPIPRGVTGIGGGSADFSPDGRLYGVGYDAINELVLAEFDTSDASVIGDTIPFPRNTETIAFRNTGLLYFVSNYNQVETFDLGTRIATQLPQPTGYGAVQGMDFGPDGRLFAISSYHAPDHADYNILLEIDLSTGVGSEVFPMPTSVPDLNSLDINARGEFYSVAEVGGAVYHINPWPGTVTQVGNAGMDTLGSLASIPEPSTVSLLALGGLLLTRRRR